MPFCSVHAARGSRQDLRVERSKFVVGNVQSFKAHHPGVAVVVEGVCSQRCTMWLAREFLIVPGQPMLTYETA